MFFQSKNDRILPGDNAINGEDDEITEGKRHYKESNQKEDQAKL